MAQLHTMRIWKLSSTPNSSQYFAGGNLYGSVPDTAQAPGNFLYGLTTADEYSKVQSAYNWIRITDDNIPNDSDLTNTTLYPNGYETSVTTETSTGQDYITWHGVRYYIRSASPALNPQLPTLSTFGTLPAVFEFYVNPTSITPTYQKLNTKMRTRGGFEVQHWGDDLTEVRVEGRSGGMQAVNGKTLPYQPGITGIDVTQSTAWITLSQLRQIYDQDQSPRNQENGTLLGLNYFDKILMGYFEDFTGPVANAEKPYLVDYSFTFKVQQEISSNSY